MKKQNLRREGHVAVGILNAICILAFVVFLPQIIEQRSEVKFVEMFAMASLWNILGTCATFVFLGPYDFEIPLTAWWLECVVWFFHVFVVGLFSSSVILVIVLLS